MRHLATRHGDGGQRPRRPDDRAAVQPPAEEQRRGAIRNHRTRWLLSHPNYTWGALLNLIAIEALCEVDGNFNPVPSKDSGITENLTLRNIPYGGKLYRIEAKGGKITATRE